MSFPLKSLQLVLDTKSSITINHRHKVITSSKIRLNQLNFHRNLCKQPKSNSAFIVKEKTEGFNDPRHQQNIVMMISCMNNPQLLCQSPIKKFIIYKQKIKRYPNEDKDENHQKKLRITSQKVIVDDREQNKSHLEDDIINKFQSQSQNLTHIKRNWLSANLSEMKSQMKSNLKPNADKKSAKLYSQSKAQKIKLPELKEQKYYPMIIREPDQLKFIKSQSFILVEYPSQRVLVSQKANLSLQIASLTKIMTFYTVLQIAEVYDVDLSREMIKVSHNVQKITGTSAQLIEDEIYSIEQLLYGLMLPSGNDAANELAYWGGNLLQYTNDYKARVKTFVGQMNRLAKTLSLKNTKFGNPHGLPHAEARSTSADIAKLCCICMRIDKFRSIVSCKKYKCTISDGTNNKREVQWQNTNKLLRREGFVGIKTGITVTAGPCLASAYNFKDKTYICVVLRAPKISSRFRQTRLIINWALSKLFKGSLTQQERISLKKLKKSNAELDSDYSEDEHEFKYDKGGSNQFKKRIKILKNEL